MLQFDAAQPLTSGSRRAFADADDPALTAFVMTLWDELFSRDPRPIPPCPRCGGAHARLHALSNNHRSKLPLFRCRDCRRFFTRLTGSPLANLRLPERMPAFIRMLSQPIPLEEASRRLGLEYGGMSNWLMRFRQLIDLHDPDGQWIGRVKLGIRYQPQGICAHCRYRGQMKGGGFGGDGRRRVRCPECGRIGSLTTDDTGTRIAVKIAHDPALTAVRRRRREGWPVPDLARAEQGVLTIPPRAPRPDVPAVNAPDVPAPQAHRFDFRQPLTTKSPLPRRYAEDTELTAYLEAEIAKVFSQATEPVPCCPHCLGGNTWFTRRHRKPPSLPEFQCGTCMRRFLRTTGTPMSKMLRKDMLMAFLPWLSQHRPAAHAAGTFGVAPETITEWVRRFRAWLLKLDSSGRHEQRVRLGLKSAWPILPCPKCGQEAPAKPRGFMRRKSIPTGRLRRFQCSACDRFFNVPVETLPGAHRSVRRGKSDAHEHGEESTWRRA
ncbi:DUF746 domain-containing protein [Caballeronia ptereochthonis]|uniref:DNA-binding protein n=1 Tax=Caballeronia ptereochthonis TaxID=1777144 RepID=A0A158E0M2_9BURK|nr:DUF746 domain-containing protein [Caballeronia ptereochthonis]SAK99487.1 DNA-binding protein [Caballeronia ptereochthonis]